METKCTEVELVEAGSFEPTYEGWKQSYKRLYGLLNLGFEPTYEGWKHHVQAMYDLYRERFEPTYEGWKPRRLRSRRRVCRVLSLPMRDGNAGKPVPTIVKSKF